MRIVDRKTFLTLPPGTAFQKGKPWYWEGLCFKTAAEYENDWRFLTIDEVSGDSEVGCCDLYDRMRDAGVSFPMSTASTRDGCFDDEDLFLIYEPADLEAVRRLIDASAQGAPAGRAAPAEPANTLSAPLTPEEIEELKKPAAAPMTHAPLSGEDPPA